MISYAKFCQLDVWTIKRTWHLPDYIFFTAQGTVKPRHALWLAIAGR